LRERIKNDKRLLRRPVAVTDGFCPGCGKFAPIAAYLDAIRTNGGGLVIDDTQALGVWGGRRTPTDPYGKGGGGSLRFLNAEDPSIVLISSLAKGFGAPLAMIAGDNNFIRRFRAKSRTMVHCSPPSAAAVSAAAHALSINEAFGDWLRRKLVRSVHLLKQQLNRVSAVTTRGLFPVQSFKPSSDESAYFFHRNLKKQGVFTVLHRRCGDRKPNIGFLVTARHSASDILLIGEMLEAITIDFAFTEKTRRLRHAI
jgi:8-amino-7-oxononanoate synthase